MNISISLYVPYALIFWEHNILAWAVHVFLLLFFLQRLLPKSKVAQKLGSSHLAMFDLFGLQFVLMRKKKCKTSQTLLTLTNSQPGNHSLILIIIIRAF